MVYLASNTHVWKRPYSVNGMMQCCGFKLSYARVCTIDYWQTFPTPCSIGRLRVALGCSSSIEFHWGRAGRAC